MVNIALPDKLVDELEAIAEGEKRPLAEIVELLIEQYKKSAVSTHPIDPFEAIIGIFDDDVSDLSTTTRETLQRLIQEKYGRTD